MKPAATTLSANLRPFKLFTARLAPSISSKSKKNLPDPRGIFQPARPFPFRQRHQHPRQLTEPRAFLLRIFQNLTRLNRIRELLAGDLCTKHDVILIAHTDTITKITKITKNNQK